MSGQGLQEPHAVSLLGWGQVVNWGILYYGFPLIAGPMSAELGFSKQAAYAAPAIGLLTASIAAVPLGRAVDRGHGRLLLVAGSLLGAALVGLWSLVGGTISLYLIFAAMGLAQAACLYDTAFAWSAWRYGMDAREVITRVSLWGGFAGTLSFPCFQWGIDHLGWRDTLLAASAAQLLLVALPYGVLLPRGRARAPVQAPTNAEPPQSGKAGFQGLDRPRKLILLGIALTFIAHAGMFSAVTFHLYPLLAEKGFPTGDIVLGMMMLGPSQVLGRVVIWLFFKERPVAGLGVLSTLAMPLSLAWLWQAPEGLIALAFFAIPWGMANGAITIVRGMAVPEMVSRSHYGYLNGLIAAPSAIVKAAAPFIAAWAWAQTSHYDGLLPAAIIIGLAAAISFMAAARMAGRGNAP